MASKSSDGQCKQYCDAKNLIRSILHSQSRPLTAGFGEIPQRSSVNRDLSPLVLVDDFSRSEMRGQFSFSKLDPALRTNRHRPPSRTGQ